MKSRLRVSLFPLLSSISGGRGAGVILLKSRLPLLNSFPFEVEGLRRSLHETAGGDDDFLELGSPVDQGAGKCRLLRLKTKKADFIRPARKSSAGASSTLKVNPVGKVPLKLDKSSSNGNKKLDETPSITWGIPNAPKRRELVDADQSDVKSESAESSEKPSEMDEKTVGGTVTITISNISAKTSAQAILAMCGVCGPFLQMIRAGDDVATVYFWTKDEADTQRILERLNCTVMDDCNWSAALASEDSFSAHAATKINSNDTSEQGLEILNQVNDFEKEITLKKLYCEDFLHLHQAIMRLESQKRKLQ